MITTGFHLNMPASVYHDDPCDTPSLSSGIARTILSKSLAHAYAEHPKLGGKPKHSTDAMVFGSLVHALIAGNAEDEIEVGNFPTFRSKIAAEWADGVRARGKMAALECDMDDARLIAAAVREKAAVGITSNPFFESGREVSGFWQRRGVLHRARYDLLQLPAGEPATAWDWKTIDDVSPQSVKRAMRKFGYHHQAAHYLAGLDALVPAFRGRHSFVFVFVEKSAPFSVRRYCLTADTLACAAIDLDRAYDAWEHALTNDEWPDASSSKTTTVDLSTYDDDEDEIATAA